MKRKIHLDECVVGGTFFIRKDAFLVTGGYSNLRFGDDTEFFEKAQKAGLNIHKFVEETYLYHRDSKDSLCGGQ